MTFVERYNQESTWHGKVLVMEIYHLAMISRSNAWTITKTAEHFGVSIGLVSENLRLATLINIDPNFSSIASRQDALLKIRRMR